jgi:predicted nucleic-acid-binding Zn-ribbon protein
MGNFTPPQSCPKCGGAMQEGLTEINSESVKRSAGNPALGARVVLGGSPSWWAIEAPEKPGIADKVLAGTPIQVLTYRCQQCGFLESYAPQSSA